MSKFTVSVFLFVLEQLESGSNAIGLHGANLSIARYITRLLASPEVDVIELFLPTDEYQRKDKIVEIATKLLPDWRKGKGQLRFHPMHSVAEVWSDAVPRILLTLDPQLWASQRYIRDRFACGPIAICTLTHGAGDMPLYRSLSVIARADPVPFDSLLCISTRTMASFKRAMRDYLEPDATVDVCRYDHVPNSVNTLRYRPATEEEKIDARRLLGLKTDGTLTLYLARITPSSKADLIPLIHAFAQNSGPNDRLLIAGIENFEGYCEKLIQEGNEIGLGDRLSILTNVEHQYTPLFYRAADIYVFPSDNVQECFANTVVEAMASGLPVISSEWDGMRDSVVHGETGYLIPTYLNHGLDLAEALSPIASFMATMMLVSQSVWVDSDELGKAIKDLLTSPELRRKMGQAARQRVEEHYTFEIVEWRMFDAWTEQLAEAMAEPPAMRESRREKASHLGIPIPYMHIFEPYATRMIDDENDLFELTDFGLKVLDGKATIKFYDETLTLIVPEAMDAIVNSLKRSPLGKWTFGSLASESAGQCGVAVDRVRFHLALMLKRGVFRRIR